MIAHEDASGGSCVGSIADVLWVMRGRANAADALDIGGAKCLNELAAGHCFAYLACIEA